MNNPLRYTDPSGHRVECGYSGEDHCGVGYGPLLPTPIAQPAPSDALDNVYEFSTTVYAVLFEPIDWLVSGLSCLRGECSPLMLAGLLPVIPAVVGRYADDAADVLRLEKKYERILGDLPLQNHHLLSNINSQFTYRFKDVLNKYDLNLSDKWNQVLIPHQGRHASQYHVWAYEELLDIDRTASGNQKMFLEQFNQRIRDMVTQDPMILRKSFWDAQ